VKNEGKQKLESNFFLLPYNPNYRSPRVQIGIKFSIYRKFGVWQKFADVINGGLDSVLDESSKRPPLIE